MFDVVRYQYKKFVITQAATRITLIQSLKWGLLNKSKGEEDGVEGASVRRGKVYEGLIAPVADMRNHFFYTLVSNYSHYAYNIK